MELCSHYSSIHLFLRRVRFPIFFHSYIVSFFRSSILQLFNSSIISFFHSSVLQSLNSSIFSFFRSSFLPFFNYSIYSIISFFHSSILQFFCSSILQFSYFSILPLFHISILKFFRSFVFLRVSDIAPLKDVKIRFSMTLSAMNANLWRNIELPLKRTCLRVAEKGRSPLITLLF